jgi:hypothetical protein
MTLAKIDLVCRRFLVFDVLVWCGWMAITMISAAVLGGIDASWFLALIGAAFALPVVFGVSLMLAFIVVSVAHGAIRAMVRADSLRLDDVRETDLNQCSVALAIHAAVPFAPAVYRLLCPH